MTGVQVPAKLSLELKTGIGPVADVLGIELMTSDRERLYTLFLR